MYCWRVSYARETATQTMSPMSICSAVNFRLERVPMSSRFVGTYRGFRNLPLLCAYCAVAAGGPHLSNLDKRLPEGAPGFVCRADETWECRLPRIAPRKRTIISCDASAQSNLSAPEGISHPPYPLPLSREHVFTNDDGARAVLASGTREGAVAYPECRARRTGHEQPSVSQPASHLLSAV